MRDQLGPLNRVLIELDGRVAGYALYRVKGIAGPEPHGVMVAIMEAMGDSPAALSAIWHYLLELDLAARFVEIHAPADHPLLLRLAEPRRLGLRLGDGLWLRLVDVERALSLRRYPTDLSLVIEVSDDFCPWNAGRYRIQDGAVERTKAAPELSLDVQALGSLYLGGFSPSALTLAGRIEEHAPGALPRADVLLHGARAPWCPEQF
jgi:predicted acetyltransferase